MSEKKSVTIEEAYRLAGIERTNTTECWQNTLDTIIAGCLAAYENDPDYSFAKLVEDLRGLGRNDIENLSCPISRP